MARKHVHVHIHDSADAGSRSEAVKKAWQTRKAHGASHAQSMVNQHSKPGESMWNEKGQHHYQQGMAQRAEKAIKSGNHKHISASRRELYRAGADHPNHPLRGHLDRIEEKHQSR